MKHVTLQDAPGVLNTNDKAMWVLGANSIIDTLAKQQAEDAKFLIECAGALQFFAVGKGMAPMLVDVARRMGWQP